MWWAGGAHRLPSSTSQLACLVRMPIRHWRSVDVAVVAIVNEILPELTALHTKLSVAHAKRAAHTNAMRVKGLAMRLTAKAQERAGGAALTLNATPTPRLAKPARPENRNASPPAAHAAHADHASQPAAHASQPAAHASLAPRRTPPRLSTAATFTD
jgi:hypothetical protein